MGTKVTEPDFLKKSWGSQMGEKPYFGGIFDVFVHISASSHQDFLKWHLYNKLNVSNTQRKPHVQEKSGSGCIVGTRPLLLRLSGFFSIFGVFYIM